MATTTQARGARQEVPVHTQAHGDGVVPMPLANIHAASTMPRRMTPDGPRLPLESMLEVPVTLVFEVCRIEIDIQQLLELTTGSHLELRQVQVDVIDIRLDDTIIGYGETIAMKQHYGIRWAELEAFLGGDDIDG